MDLQLFLSVLLVVSPCANQMKDSFRQPFISEDTCPSYVSFECTVTGSPMGATLWNISGPEFQDCPENHIILRHRARNEMQCGSIRGVITEVVNSSYTSQLNIALDFDIIGRRIECFLDNNTNTMISITSSLISANIEHAYLRQGSLHFKWTLSIFLDVNNSAISYNIQASNCGHCPTTTNHTSVTCTDVPSNDGVCNFTIQIHVCENCVGSVYHTFPLPTRPDHNSTLLPALISGILILGVLILIVGATMILVFYKRYRTSNQFSQSSTVTTKPLHCQTQVSLNEMDANVYDDLTTVKVFDNKLASGIYGSAVDDAAPNAQYEDYVPRSGEGKLDLESLLAYLRGRVTFQWYKFGAALGVPSNILENFVRDSEKYSKEKALNKVLEYWLKNHPTQPSWQEVANALRDIIWIS